MFPTLFTCPFGRKKETDLLGLISSNDSATNVVGGAEFLNSNQNC